jgi:hypothetical protein
MAIQTFENTSLTDFFRKAALYKITASAYEPNLLNKPLDAYFENEDEGEYRSIPLNNEIDVGSEILPLIRSYKEKEIPSKFIAAKNLAN